MFMYEFNALGITFTVVGGVLILLLAASAVAIALRKKARTASTVVFRVIDIVVCALLLTLWTFFILSFTSAMPAALAPLSAILQSGLGILLMSLASISAAVSLTLSFTLRRKSAVAEVSAEAFIPAAGQNMLFELMTDLNEANEPAEAATVAKAVQNAEEAAEKGEEATEGGEGQEVKSAFEDIIRAASDDAALKMFETYLEKKTPDERKALLESMDEVVLK